MIRITADRRNKLIALVKNPPRESFGVGTRINENELIRKIDEILALPIRVPTKDEAKAEANARFPKSKPRNYLIEGQWLGFMKCHKWLTDEISLEPEITDADIEAWANEKYDKYSDKKYGPISELRNAKNDAIEGAKAMRDNKIKHL